MKSLKLFLYYGNWQRSLSPGASAFLLLSCAQVQAKSCCWGICPESLWRPPASIGWTVEVHPWCVFCGYRCSYATQWIALQWLLLPDVDLSVLMTTVMALVKKKKKKTHLCRIQFSKSAGWTTHDLWVGSPFALFCREKSRLTILNGTN